MKTIFYTAGQFRRHTHFMYHCFLFVVAFYIKQLLRITGMQKTYWNIKKKAIALGVPYVTFSSITLLMKNVFSAEVNNAAPPFLKTLFLEPIAPYWYFVHTVFAVLHNSASGGQRKKGIRLSG